VSKAVLLEVHMQNAAGREFGVDTHFVGDSIKQLDGHPGRKDIFNQNCHANTPLLSLGTACQKVGCDTRGRDGVCRALPATAGRLRRGPA
jgi:hypothetical protein